MTKTNEKAPLKIEYQKVTKDDVYHRLASLSLDFMNPIGGAISLVNLARLMNTSRYQVKKYIDELRKEGIVELRCFNISEEDFYPPYWGYLLTDKGRDTEIFREMHKKDTEIMLKCFS